MPIVRTVARGVLVWSLLAAGARADSKTVKDDGSANWTFYVSGSDGSGDRKDLSGYLGNPPSAPAPEPAGINPPPASQGPVSPPPASAGSQAVLGSNGSAGAATGQNNAPGAPATADAFINFGTSSFPEANILTTGSPQPWYTSQSVRDAFHGATPTPDQQTQFTNEVLADVRHTFNLAGLDPKLTTDPTVQVSHTLSVVSGASYGPNGNAIGITDVGRNGFGFIDKLDYATNPDQLAWAVAHNVSHELMHAFGIGNHPDTTGNYIDAATASWDLLTKSDTTFSPAAVALLSKTNFSGVSSPSALGKETLAIDGAQEIMATVPEPTTVAAWSLVAAGALMYRRTRAVRAAA